MSGFQPPAAKIIAIETRLKAVESKLEKVTSGASLVSSGTGGSTTGVLQDHDHTGTSSGGTLTGDKHDSFSQYVAIADPASPAAGSAYFYVKLDAGIAKLFYKQSDGTVVGPLMGGGAPVGAQYLVLAADGTLTSERIWTPGNGLQGTDGGAGAAYTAALGALTAPWDQSAAQPIYTLGRIGIGVQSTDTNPTSLDVDGSLLTSSLAARPNASPAGLLFTLQSNAVPTTIGAGITLARSRGSFAAQTIISSGDLIGSFKAYGYDGVHYQPAAFINCYADGTVAADQMPGRLSLFVTPAATKLAVERMRINNAGRVSISALSTGAVAANAAALLDLVSPTGAGLALGLLVPRWPTTDVTASPVNGLVGYDSTTNKFIAYENGTWKNLIATGATNTLLDGANHTDTLAGSVADGDIIIGNVTPKWSRLGITVPAANILEVLGVVNGETRPSWKAVHDGTNPAAIGTVAPGTALTAAHRDHVHATGAGTPSTQAIGDAAATGSGPAAAMTDHKHAMMSYATLAANLFTPRQFVFAPDAAPATTIVAGNQQGNIYHSGPNGFTAVTLYVDAETAPGASGLPITIEYGDTNDLDTVASWTTIATYTLSSEKSNKTTSMTNASVPADRLIRMNVGTIVGTPKDTTVTLEGKVALLT